MGTIMLVTEPLFIEEDARVAQIYFHECDAAEKYGIPEDQFRMLMRQNRQVMDQLLAEKAMTALIDYAVVTDVDADTQQPIV